MALQDKENKRALILGLAMATHQHIKVAVCNFQIQTVDMESHFADSAAAGLGYSFFFQLVASLVSKAVIWNKA